VGWKNGRVLKEPKVLEADKIVLAGGREIIKIPK